MFANYAQTIGEVPVKVSMQSWMVKICERQIQLAEPLAEVVQQFRCMRTHFRKRHAWQVGQQPHKVGGAGWRFNL
jgi:hypothetical protein